MMDWDLFDDSCLLIYASYRTQSNARTIRLVNTTNSD
jgi:hypothetical protein